MAATANFNGPSTNAAIEFTKTVLAMAALHARISKHAGGWRPKKQRNLKRRRAH